MKYKISLIFILLSAIALFSQTGWQKEFSKNGIDVYTRPIPGTSIKEFKGTGVIDGSIEEVNAILDNIPGLKNWMPDCLVSKVIEKKGSGHLIIYQVIKTPWPLEHRDFAFETVITVSREKITRTVKAVSHPSVPKVDKYVRITDMTGEWILKRHGEAGDKTYAEYRIKSDPGGNIPASIANSTSKKLPYETILGLRKQLKK
jgi:hypothetical protein